jgi:ATP-binding cassette subfamily F protein 3
VQAFDGDLDDYKQWLNTQKRTEEKAVLSGEVVGNVSRKDQRKRDAEWRQQHKPLFDALKKAENALESYHQQQQQLEQQLADPTLYDDANKARLKQLLNDKANIDKQLTIAEEAWLTAEENIAQAQQAN